MTNLLSADLPKMQSKRIGNNASTMHATCYYLIHMQEPLETAELLALAKTVEAKSLSRAAAELGVPRATISRRLSRLEERLGARLLRRTTRSLTLTDAGEALYRHARIVLSAVEAAEASVRRSDDEVRGDLRVSVPPVVDEAFFAMISSFAEQYPHVRLQVHFSTTHVDLQRDGFDVALRGGGELEPGLVARTLMRSRLVAVASPTYLAAYGTPRSKRDLKKHRCMMGFARGELPATYWSTSSGLLHLESSFASNEIRLLASAALRGLGIAYLPESIIKTQLDEGTLVQVLPGVLENKNRMALIYVEREFMPPQVRAFVDHVVAAMPSLTDALGPGKPAKKAGK
jgi:DNA-binding transcriptional LysR family regulator